MHRCSFALVSRSLVMLIAAAALAGCVTDANGVHLAATAAPAPQAEPAPASAAEPAEPETEQHASAVCWMKYEHGRRDLALDKRMKLVDACIDERLKVGAAH